MYIHISFPTERATNHDISTTISITLHRHKLHRGTLDFGLGKESSHVFARDNVMNGAIFMPVTDYDGRTVIQGPGSSSHLKINKLKVNFKKLRAHLTKARVLLIPFYQQMQAFI